MTGGRILAAALLALGAVPAAALDLPLDLSAAANFAFHDQVAGDGVGGWSDQGSENDLAGFDCRRTDFGGMTFAILDPERNAGRTVLTFDSPRARSGLSSARAALPADGRVRHLYLLHTTCWNQAPRGARIGAVAVPCRDGRVATIPVAAGIEVGDWWNAGDCDNGRVVYRRQNGSAQVGIFLSRLDLPADAVPGATLTLSGTGAAVWIVLAATASDRRLDLGAAAVRFQAGAEWKAADMPGLLVGAGSALDLSATVEEGPAGRHGRAIIAADGSLAFADQPDRPRRLFGFNGLFWGIRQFAAPTPDETAARIVAYAEGVRRQGYDLVRPLVTELYLMEGSGEEAVFNPARLAVIDRLFAELKARGVYIYLTVGAYQNGLVGKPRFQDSGLFMLQMLLGDERIRRNWRRVAESMLAHVNPHTGLAWKDDPAIVCLEFYNEQEIGYERLAVADPATRALLETRWRTWLQARYRTPEGLAAAWGAAAPAGWDAVRMPEQARGPGTPANDAALFLRDLAREELAWCEGVVRAAGYRGLTSQFNYSKLMLDSAVRWEGSAVVSMNSYFSHPSALSRPGSQCGQGSSVEAAGLYWREAAAVRCADRPLFITEHHHAFWNPYQHEDGLLFAAYAALQGFAAVTVHEDAVATALAGPVREFSVAESPVARANEFLAACLFHRGDVQRARGRVELQLPAEALAGNGNGSKAVNGHQSRLALMTGFSVAFPGRTACPGTGRPPPAALVLGPAGGAEVVAGGWSSSVVESADSPQKLAEQVAALKRDGILPPGNASDPLRGVFQSDTGEITMHAAEGLLTVATAASEGAVLKRGAVELPHLAVRASSVPAAVALCAVDGRMLGASARLVLVYATEAANTGMELSADRVTMREQGKPPVLLRTGRLSAVLRLGPGPLPMVYALGLDGRRRGRLAVAATADGGVALEIDTAQLADGPTPFFEVVRE